MVTVVERIHKLQQFPYSQVLTTNSTTNRTRYEWNEKMEWKMQVPKNVFKIIRADGGRTGERGQPVHEDLRQCVANTHDYTGNEEDRRDRK